MWKNTLWLTWPCLLSQPKDLSDNSWNFQELVEHPPKVTMLADWPSIAEGFPKACSRVTSYTMIIVLFVNFCFKSFFFFFFWLLLPINSYTYAACQQISKPLIKVLCSFFIHHHQFLHVKEQSIHRNIFWKGRLDVSVYLFLKISSISQVKSGNLHQCHRNIYNNCNELVYWVQLLILKDTEREYHGYLQTKRYFSIFFFSSTELIMWIRLILKLTFWALAIF